MIDYDNIIKTLKEFRKDIIKVNDLDKVYVKLNKIDVVLDELDAFVKQQNIEANDMGIMHELDNLRSLERGK